MTTSPPDPMLTEVLGERTHLFNLAFRMLGTTADAEDAVQETYARWFRLGDDERAGIRSPTAWLTRVAGRVCLDVLGSARHRRELYVGEWLPEPLMGGPVGGTAGSTAGAAVGGATSATPVDPLDRVMLDDSISMALLVVLETLTPAERVAFVLHDVFALSFDEIAGIVGRTPQACRKLASTARRHVAERRRREEPVERHHAVVQEFWAACAGGDLTALLRLLDPAVVTLVDGGGKVSAALRPIRGAEKVARYVLGGLAKQPGLVASLETVSGRTGVVLRSGAGRGEGAGATGGAGVAGVVSIVVRDGLVTDLWLVMSPDKLAGWR